MATPQIAHDITEKTVNGLITHAAPEGGVPVLFHLTTPSMPLPFFGMPAMMREALLPGIRPLTYFRPGYLGTDGKPWRTVADAAADAAAVLDAWNVEKAVMYGGSGGGPHALACAALIPDRVAGVVTDGSPAPFELLGDAAFEGMFEMNRIGHEMAMTKQGDLLDRMRSVFDVTHVAEDPDGTVARARSEIMAGGLPLGTTPEMFAALLVENGRGWADDVVAITKPWGFGLADVTAPVRVFIGARDTMSPPAHGRFLVAHLPQATAFEYDGGHGALGERLPDVTAALLELGEGLA